MAPAVSTLICLACHPFGVGLCGINTKQTHLVSPRNPWVQLLTVIIDYLLHITQNLGVPPLRDVGLMFDRFAIGLKHGCGVRVQHKRNS
jgi:hypothetical protein